MTHALQVLHTLQWHHPVGPARLQLAQAPTQDYHYYTHALLGGVERGGASRSGSPVRLPENTELLSVCGLRGTPQRVFMLGLGGKECTLACTAHMLMESDSLPCLRQSRSFLFV